MSKFMFVFRGGAVATTGVSPTDVQAHLKKWHDWVGAMAKSGKTHPGGGRLMAEGMMVRGTDRTTTDGPYAESKDLITGNLIIEAASLAEATELAGGCPIFEFDGSVEVRPIHEM